MSGRRLLYFTAIIRQSECVELFRYSLNRGRARARFKQNWRALLRIHEFRWKLYTVHIITTITHCRILYENANSRYYCAAEYFRLESRVSIPPVLLFSCFLLFEFVERSRRTIIALTLSLQKWLAYPACKHIPVVLVKKKTKKKGKNSISYICFVEKRNTEINLTIVINNFRSV